MKKFKVKKKILSPSEIKDRLDTLSENLLRKYPQPRKLVLIGIYTRGVYIARRIKEIIKDKKSIDVLLGSLDITLYRDDLTSLGPKPLVRETKIDFDINNRIVVLVDDVLFTGRTVRAALDEIIDFGRPKKVELLVLVDRGHRELPIQPDFVGEKIKTSVREMVEVKMVEVDGKDGVFLMERIDG